jgi:hypothetical protein
MDDFNKQMVDHGLFIYQCRDGRFCLQKVPTKSDDSDTIPGLAGLPTPCLWFETYAEADRHARACLGIAPRRVYFAAQVRFDRGLGWEVHDIPGVFSDRVSEAKRAAEREAQDYFKRDRDFGEVRRWEVRIRPGRVG